MNFRNNKANIFIPGGTPLAEALKRTTTLCIAAHQDDTEIMAFHAIAECYDDPKKAFGSVIVTDGAGSPRAGIYKDYTDEEMKKARLEEQKLAAQIGRYAVLLQLLYTSGQVKDPGNKDILLDIQDILEACAPETVITHNPADKHDTHVAVALRTIAAIRKMDAQLRPKKLYGMEVWRNLDWLCDEDKQVFDASAHPNIAAALLGVFDSQICGGKRYDAAALGRRTANATFFGDHHVDDAEAAAFGLDMTEMIENPVISPAEFIGKYIDGFRNDVKTKISRLER